MATSDHFIKRKEINKVKYVITGEGGLRLIHDCSNYETSIEAENSAIARAINLAKVFTGISLYRVIGKKKEEIFWHKSKTPKKNKPFSFSGYFNL